MARYRHVIWDWNGTLLDDVGLCIEVMNDMLDARRLPSIDAVRYREIFDFPVIGYYRALGFDFAGEPFEHLATEFCDRYDRRVADCTLHAGVAAALERLADSVARQSILSSSEQEALDSAIDRFGLGARFAEVVGQSHHYATGKAATGRALMSSSPVAAAGTVLVGDTLHDHEVAQALGIDCVLVSIGHHSRKKLEMSGDTVVDSLDEVIEYLG